MVKNELWLLPQTRGSGNAGEAASLEKGWEGAEAEQDLGVGTELPSWLQAVLTPLAAGNEQIQD